MTECIKGGKLKVLLLCFLLLLMPYKVKSVEVNEILNVLFISSNNPNHEAFNDQIEGIRNGFNSTVQLQIEYADTKIFDTIEKETNFYNLLKYKINNYDEFDAIILGDGQALNFGLKYKDELFMDIPMVFFGVNDKNLADLAVKAGLTGVIEVESIEDNLELISKLHIDAKKIVLLKDWAYGSKREIEFYYSLQSKYPQYEFSHISLENVTFEQFEEQLNKLIETDIILSLFPQVDATGKELQHGEAIRLISSATNVPIYDISVYGVGSGSIGGKVINQYEQGRLAGEITEKILYGLEPETLYIDDDRSNTYIFDYEKLQQYKIKEELLPGGSIIINKPDPFRVRYREIIIPSVLVFIGLIIIIISLIYYSIHHKIQVKKILQAKELAEKANREKDNFISNISHELRTPISVIMSANQLLKIKLNKLEKSLGHIEKGNKLDGNLNVITQNCYRLLRLVNNIIDVAKLDSGFVDVSFKNVNVVDLLERIFISILPYAEIKNINLIFDTEEEEVIMALDGEKIEKIVLNLLSNAIKFSDENGYISMDVFVKNDNVIFTVTDNGSGIKEDHLGKIFDRFIQSDCETMKRNEGSGIGLSIAKSFVEMHCGRIYVDSMVGQGTMFIVELPIRILNEDVEESINIIDDEKSTIITTKVEFSEIYF